MQYPIKAKLLRALFFYGIGITALAAFTSFVVPIRSFDSQIIAIVWATVAAVGFRFQLPNLGNAYINWKIGRLMKKSPRELDLLLAYLHRNLIRGVVIPLMILVGILSFFVPVVHQQAPVTPIGVVLGILLLIALVGNEFAFGLLAILEYRAMGPFRSLKNLRKSLQVP